MEESLFVGVSNVLPSSWTIILAQAFWCMDSCKVCLNNVYLNDENVHLWLVLVCWFFTRYFLENFVELCGSISSRWRQVVTASNVWWLQVVEACWAHDWVSEVEVVGMYALLCWTKEGVLHFWHSDISYFNIYLDSNL